MKGRSLAISGASWNSRERSQVDVGKAPSLGIWEDATHCDSANGQYQGADITTEYLGGGRGKD